MTLQYQPRYGGAVTGRRFEEFSKDAGTRTRNAAIGGAVGGGLAYQGTGLAISSALHDTVGRPQGNSFMQTAKPVMRRWNSPSSMKYALGEKGFLRPKGLAAIVGGGAAIGAGIGALRGGKPKIAPTYNTTYEKADNWRNISEHQTQAAQGRRRTRHGGFVASIGAGAIGAAGTEGLHQANAIRQAHHDLHRETSATNQYLRAELGPKMGIGFRERAKAHAQLHGRSVKIAPLGHVTGLGAGALAVGTGMALSGAHKRRKHDRAITQLRRQRATTPVGKSRAFDPEASRQRHLGAAEAVTGLAGAGALGTGLHGIQRTTRIARQTPTAYTLPKEETHEEQKARLRRQKAAGQKPTVPRGDHIRFGEMKATRHLVGGKRRDVLLAAGGLAGLGAAGAIHNHAHSARGRTWY